MKQKIICSSNTCTIFRQLQYMHNFHLFWLHSVSYHISLMEVFCLNIFNEKRKLLKVCLSLKTIHPFLCDFQAECRSNFPAKSFVPNGTRALVLLTICISLPNFFQEFLLWFFVASTFNANTQLGIEILFHLEVFHFCSDMMVLCDRLLSLFIPLCSRLNVWNHNWPLKTIFGKIIAVIKHYSSV